MKTTHLGRPPSSGKDPRRRTRAELHAKLFGRLQPIQRAREDAERLLHQPPQHIVQAFIDEVEEVRRAEQAELRTEAMDALVELNDAAGELKLPVAAQDAAKVVADVTHKLDRLRVERADRREAALRTHAMGLASWRAYSDVTGAKRQTGPWPAAAMTALVITTATGVEVFGAAQLLEGPPIAGAPSPALLGLLFAGISVTAGAMLAVAWMLFTDKRRSVKSLGGLGLAAGGLAWAFNGLAAAHARACIELGGGGSIPEIIASLQAGWLDPLVSPLAQLLVAASTITTAVTTLKLLGHFGAPMARRQKDLRLRWAEEVRQAARDADRDAITALAAEASATLDGIESAAQRTAASGLGYLRELQLLVARAREAERDIDRVLESATSVYSATFQRIRSADLSGLPGLAARSDETLGEPEEAERQVRALQASVAPVLEATSAARRAIGILEVQRIGEIEALYEHAAHSERRRRHTDDQLLVQPSPIL